MPGGQVARSRVEDVEDDAGVSAGTGAGVKDVGGVVDASGQGEGSGGGGGGEGGQERKEENE